MKLFRNKLVRQGIALIVIAVVAYYFYSSLRANWSSVREIEFTFNWFIIAAVLLFMVAVVVSGWFWGLMMNILIRGTGRTVTVLEAVRVHIASWLLKYIPGQAGSLVNKVIWANAKGIGKKVVVISFLYENILLIIASFIAGIPLLFAANASDTVSQNTTSVIAVLIVLVLGILSTRTKSMHKLLSFLLRRFGVPTVTNDLFLSYWQVSRLQALYLLPRILNGVGAVFVALSIVPVPHAAFVQLGASYIVAATIGMLALFVPSGIGVRESVFVLLVSTVIPPEKAILIAVVARFYSTLADIGLAGLYLLIKSPRKLPS
jgi:uncharacterized membrane protein YbhN (UPF0104 family)